MVVCYCFLVWYYLNFDLIQFMKKLLHYLQTKEFCINSDVRRQNFTKGKNDKKFLIGVAKKCSPE